jgi:hypothetical protein
MYWTNAQIRASFQTLKFSGAARLSGTIGRERRFCSWKNKRSLLMGRFFERSRVAFYEMGPFQNCAQQPRANERCSQMAIVASTAPGNIWTRDEFATLIRCTVAALLDLPPGDLPTADEAKINSATVQVCGEITYQVAPAGNA